jgi:hypothetical protein
VLIAQNSSRRRPWRARIFSKKEVAAGLVDHLERNEPSLIDPHMILDARFGRKPFSMAERLIAATCQRALQ